jgi:hypothetical protein
MIRKFFWSTGNQTYMKHLSKPKADERAPGPGKRRLGNYLSKDTESLE